MRAVADALGVSRSYLAEQLKGKSKPREPYHKVEDAELLSAIRRLVDQGPTYGDRRIAALLNRERRAADQPVVNAKRVHRITGSHDMLLEKHTAVRKGRLHDGKVMVMRLNLRWCSDGLKFTWLGMVRSFVSPSLSTPSTARSLPGQQLPMRERGKRRRVESVQMVEP